MAATVRTDTWDAAWTTTMRAKRKRMTDNISDSYPTVGEFRRSGIMEVENGGKEIQEDLMYALNSLEWFDGYDNLNTAAVDGITAAFYQFRYSAVPITISMTEEKESRKSDSAVKLLTAKTEQSMTTAFDGINAALHSAQSGKSILGLQDVVAQSSGTTLGGISSSSESWWDNKRTDYTATYTVAFNAKHAGGDMYAGVLAMRDLWNEVSEGNDKPDLIITDFDTYGDYESIFEGTGHYRFTSQSDPKIGVTDVPTFRGAKVIPDRDCAADTLYMLQKKYLKMKVQAGLNFAKTPFKEPSNQLAKVAFIIFGAQLVTNNRRRQGVLYSITNAS